MTEENKNLIPYSKESIIAALWSKVQEQPNFKILSWVDNQCEEVNSLTYAQIWEQSGAVQQLIQEKNLKPGDRVMICYPFGLEFLAGFFGSIRAGVIPCSVYPPNPKQPKNSIKIFADMAKDAGAKYALTTKQFQRAMGLLQVAGHRPGVTWLATDTLKPVQLPFVEPDLFSPAFIQYTSGSTSAPKGVVISHGAIAHSIHVTTQYMTDFKMDVGKTRYQIVSWLPQYHDMGLMNGFLMPLVSGAPCVNTSPLNFIKNPLIWADMIEKYKATSIVSPNFGYGLLAKRLQQAGRTMDASTITTAVNAAEPVSLATLKQMVDVLGIQTTAVLPAYGAAESVAIVGGSRGIKSNEDGFVACGDISESLLFEKSIVILDDSMRLVPDGTVGRIHFTGPDLASGYFNNPTKTEETFKVNIAGSDNGKFYYDSGDLGMIKNGKLFITGRAKELIIINGVNKYPTDLEHSIEAAFPDTVRPGCTVAFQYNESQVGCVLELRKDIQGSQAPSVDEIKNVLVRENAITVDYVVILKADTVPKTTSGKLRRLEAGRISHSGKWPQKSVIMEWRSGHDAFGGKVDFNRNLNSNLPQRIPLPKESILAALWNKVQEKPNFEILTWVDDQCREVNTLTYAQLWEQSGGVQQLLQEKNLRPGDRVMVCYPFGLEFLAGFFGSIRAGVIPCSVYPPNPKQPKNSIKIFADMAKDAGAKYALTTKQFQRAMGLLQVAGHRPGVTWLATDTLKPVQLPFVEPDLFSPAFIQYTSGSTSAPKGVVISHGAIAHNIHVTTHYMTDFKMDVGSKRYQGVSWLPQYHDMGLINGFLCPIVSGAPCANSSPISFIKNPLIWADMIEKYQATCVISPNFGWGLLAKRLQQAGRKLDASTITTAVNSAEPVSAATLNEMVDVLGIKQTAVLAAYGAAESVATISASRGIEINDDGVVASGDVQSSLLFKKSIVILDDSKLLVPDGTVGRIHFTGLDLATGYWNNPTKTEETFRVKIGGSHDDRFYCDSGDLGMIANGKLFITGRAKELIIINGVNKYPTDLERSVEMEWPDSVRPGCCVAFQWNEEKAGMVIELRKDVKPGSVIPCEKDIKALLSAEQNVLCGYICFLAPHTIPKTTSGKLKRLETASISKSDGWKKKSVVSSWCEDIQYQMGSFLPIQGPDVTDSFVCEQELETKLSGIVSLVSGANVSRTDSIASLGLSSMDLVRLQGMMVDKLGLTHDSVPLTCFFDGELTVEDLSKRLSSASNEPTTSLDHCPYVVELPTSAQQVTELLAKVFEDVIGLLPKNDQSMGNIGVSSMNATLLHDAIVDTIKTEAFPIVWLLDEELSFEDLTFRLYQGMKSHKQKTPMNPPRMASNSVLSALSQDTGVVSPPLLIANVRRALQLVVLFIPPVFLAATLYPSAFLLYWMTIQFGTWIALLLLPGSILMYTLTSAALLIVLKWILLGKQKPGVCGVWSGRFARRWLVRQCSRICWRITPWTYLGGTEAIAVLHRLLGCKLGRGVSLDPGCIEDYDLVEVGDFSSISGTVLTETVSLGVQTTFRTKIGFHSVVSDKAIISPNVVIGDKVTVGIRCAVPSSASLESGTEWRGKPARQQAQKKMDIYNFPLPHDMYIYSATLYGSLVLSSYLWALEFIFAIFVGLILWENLGWMGFAPLVWVPATLTFGVVWILTVFAKKLLLGKVEEGTWPLYGSFHCRKLLVDHLVEAHLLVWIQLLGISGSPLIGWSRFHSVILQSLGSKICLVGNVPVEAWTAYDLLECSSRVTFGGGTSLHFFSEKDGHLVACKIDIGEDVFIGTTCALVAPLLLEDGATVAGHGTASGKVASNETVINTLVMKRQSDQRHGDVPQRSFGSNLAELAVGTTMLAFVVLAVGLLWLTGISFNDISGIRISFNDIAGISDVAIAAAVLSYTHGLILPLFVAMVLLISKHAVVGRYKPLVLKHGSLRYHVYQWAVTLKIVYERPFMDAFSGTFLEVLFHKLMGAHLGNGVYLDGAFFFEHDLIQVGSYTSITGWVGLAPHRIDRSGDSFSKLRIGNRCNIRCDATLHGNDIVDDDVTLDALSMPLIGSHLIAGTWRGYPATRADGVEPMPARPPKPLWYVLLRRPSTAICGAAFCIAWWVYSIWEAIAKHVCVEFGCIKRKRRTKSSLEMDDTFPIEHDLEAGLPHTIPYSLVLDHSNDEETSGMGMFDEFIFDLNSWEPSLRSLTMNARTKCTTWWKWTRFDWSFNSELNSAHGDIILGNWRIPSEILSATLEHMADQDCWVLSLCWLEGEPQRMLLKVKSSKSSTSTDVIVVGAGIQGLCFARDLASLGHSVLVCERSSQIGGVWATNNYPGLRLHIPGHMYRCASLAPGWNHKHNVEENYRPTRDEILDYCKELSQHENITLHLNSSCDYQKAEEVKDGIVVPIAGVQHHAKFLFVSVNSTFGFQGTKHLPEALPDNLASLPCSPQCFHSSEFSAKDLASMKLNKRKLVIVGSGKAAIDLLQHFEPGDKSVIWAHRGHTAFVRRTKPPMDKQVQMLHLYCHEAAKEGLGRHWSELALEDGALIACDGPMKQYRVKCKMGICDESEIEHANSFSQFYFHSIKVDNDGRVSLVSDDGSSMCFNEQECIVWCTGQRNSAFEMPKLKKRLATAGAYSAISFPMYTYIPLLCAIDQLTGTGLTSERIQNSLNALSGKVDPQKYQSGQDLEDAVFMATNTMPLFFFCCDPAVHPGWQNEWYSKNVPVVQVLKALLRPETKYMGAFLETTTAIQRNRRNHPSSSQLPLDKYQQTSYTTAIEEEVIDVDNVLDFVAPQEEEVKFELAPPDESIQEV